MPSMNVDQRAEAVRAFNRFYAQQIGVLRQGYLASPFSLAEVRVLYELAHRDGPTATELGKDLGLDAGYLSRILRGFQKRSFLVRSISKHDGRQSHLSLTPRGRKAFAPLQAKAHRQIATMLGKLSEAEQVRLIEAMRVIESLLGAPRERATP